MEPGRSCLFPFLPVTVFVVGLRWPLSTSLCIYMYMCIWMYVCMQNICWLFASPTPRSISQSANGPSLQAPLWELPLHTHVHDFCLSSSGMWATYAALWPSSAVTCHCHSCAVALLGHSLATFAAGFSWALCSLGGSVWQVLVLVLVDHCS